MDGNKLQKDLASIISENFPETTNYAGTATAGIPHAAWVADILGITNVLCSFKSKRTRERKSN